MQFEIDVEPYKIKSWHWCINILHIDINANTFITYLFIDGRKYEGYYVQ